MIAVAGGSFCSRCGSFGSRSGSLRRRVASRLGRLGLCGLLRSSSRDSSDNSLSLGTLALSGFSGGHGRLARRYLSIWGRSRRAVRVGTALQLRLLALALDTQVVLLSMGADLGSRASADVARNSLDVLLPEELEALEEAGVLVGSPIAGAGLFGLLLSGRGGGGLLWRWAGGGWLGGSGGGNGSWGAS